MVYEEQFHLGDWLLEFISGSMDNVIPAIFMIGLSIILIALILNLSPPLRFPKLFK